MPRTRAAMKAYDEKRKGRPDQKRRIANMTPEQLDAYRERSRAYYRKNRDELLLDQTRRRREAGVPERIVLSTEEKKVRLFAKKYKISNEFAAELLSRTVCDSCGDSSWRLCIDHCHTSGRVRGVLCHGCNVALGHLLDDPHRIKNLLNYSTR